MQSASHYISTEIAACNRPQQCMFRAVVRYCWNRLLKCSNLCEEFDENKMWNMIRCVINEQENLAFRCSSYRNYASSTCFWLFEKDNFGRCSRREKDVDVRVEDITEIVIVFASGTGDGKRISFCTIFKNQASDKGDTESPDPIPWTSWMKIQRKKITWALLSTSAHSTPLALVLSAEHFNGKDGAIVMVTFAAVHTNLCAFTPEMAKK